MKKLTFIIPALSLVSILGIGQDIKLETSVVSNSVALHPMIFDVQNDGKNAIGVIDDDVDVDGNDALNTKTVVWFSGQGKSGGEGFKETVIGEMNYRSCGKAHADLDNDGYIDIIGREDTDGNDMNETGSMFWLK